MKTPNRDETYHVVDFHDDAEADAFVRALQRWLGSPAGRLWAEDLSAVEIRGRLRSASPVSLFLNGSAVEATEEGFAPATVTRTVQGVEVPHDAVLLLHDVTLAPREVV